MTEEVKVRRVGANQAAACVEALADVLIDCVEGGSSVSFMLPLPRGEGVVPKYALLPNGDFCATTFFCKHV